MNEKSLCLQAALDLWSCGVLLSALWTGTQLFQFEVTLNVAVEHRFLLQSVVNVLGGPEKHWPEIAQLPKWVAFQNTLEILVPRMSLTETLKCVRSVRRPLSQWPQVADLIALLLRWKPSSRASAATCLQHRSMECYGKYCTSTGEPRFRGFP